jgi:phosphoribosyl 1,2-cyclic phosphodiesterase
MSMEVTFFGVRGSTPCSSDNHQRYGGNTSCVVIERTDREPIILDLGTGLRFFGLERAHGDPFRASALVSHLHWDHVQGIPFFTPLLSEGAQLDLYGPTQDGGSLQETVRSFLSPPYFPVDIEALPCEITFHEISDSSFEIDGAKVQAAEVPHIGPTLGFRVECDGTSIAYVSDHQQPGVGADHVSETVLELAAGVDLLIHDAQFDDLEFAIRHDWGHCTVDYAVEVAAQAGAKTLALFHHDPSHHDAQIDELLSVASSNASARGVPEVIAAHEGLTVSLEQASLSQSARN